MENRLPCLRWVGVLCAFALSITTATAAVKMPAIFGDHMILQQSINSPSGARRTPARP